MKILKFNFSPYSNINIYINHITNLYDFIYYLLRITWLIYMLSISME